MARADQALDEFLESPRVAAWETRMSAVFFDDEAKRALIEEMRTDIAAAEIGGDDAVKAVIGRVIAGASRSVVRPRDPESGASGAEPLLTGDELGDHIIGAYPAPIARAYRAMLEQPSDAGAFGCLLNTVEGMLHLLAAVAVAAYIRSDVVNPDVHRAILSALLKEAWATGDLLGLVREMSLRADEYGGHLPYPLASHFFKRGKPSASLRVLGALVAMRNREWGHGTERTEQLYASILPPNRALLEGELARMTWLETWQLVRPVSIVEDRVTSIDVLMGERRLAKRSFDMALEARDVESGDVRAERTLLLVSPDRSRYLPLFPMSLFAVKKLDQGVYFLQRPQWQRTSRGRSIRRANYVAYASAGGEHEEDKGYPAALALEQRVARLEAELGQGAEPPPDPTPHAADEDFTLPEVAHEQAIHVRSFVGREDVLAEISAWIDASTDGRYLLLVGPPGQGKSALMAELARREATRGACVLHMIKSHRQPRKFVPSLVSQAARLAETSFGNEAYHGDVDDMRNALVRALGALVDKRGRAVVVIDAMDELEGGADRIAFLPAALPTGVRVILTSRPDIPLVHSLRARLGHVDERAVPVFGVADMPSFLERRLGAERARAVDVDALYRRTAGTPLLLLRAVERLAASPDVRVDELPATLDEMFADVYAAIADKDGTVFRSDAGRTRARLVQLLCMAREPLNVDALCEVAAAGGLSISLEDGRDRVFEMSAYLLDVGGECFKPWHQGLTDFVRERILGREGQRRTDEAFARWLDGARTRTSPYALRHAVEHDVLAERFDRAAERLLDPAFLEAKVDAGLVFDVVAELDAASERAGRGPGSRPFVRLLRDALRSDAHFLARHPEALFQCVYARGHWYDATESAVHHEPGAIGPWSGEGPKLSAFIETWRASMPPRSAWLRALRPLPDPIGAALRARLYGHDGDVRCVAVSPDGRTIASGGDDRTLRLWNARTGREIACGRGHDRRVLCVAFSAEGGLIASGGEDNSIRVWDLEGRCLQVLGGQKGDAGHKGPVYAVAMPAATRVLSGSRDKTVMRWTLGGPAVEVTTVGTHERPVVRVYEDGGSVVSISTDGAMRTWGADGRESARVVVPVARVADVARSPDGEYVAMLADDEILVESRDGQVARLRYDEQQAAHLARTGPIVARGHDTSLPRSRLAFDRSSSRLAMIWNTFRRSGRGTFRGVRLHDLASGTERLLSGVSRPAHAIAFGPAATLVTAGTDRALLTWDGDEDIEGVHATRLTTGRGDVSQLRFMADGSHFLVARADGLVELWNATSGLLLDETDAHRVVVTALEVSADGRHVVSGATDGSVVVWPLGPAPSDRSLKRILTQGRIEDLAVTESHVVSCQRSDPLAHVFSVVSGELVSTLAHDTPVTACGSTRDGHIMTACADGSVRLWSLPDARCLATHALYGGPIHRVSEAPSGRIVWWGGDAVVAWQPVTNETQVHRDASGRNYARERGARMWFERRDGETRFCDVATGRTLAYWPAPLAQLRHSSDGVTFAGSLSADIVLLSMMRPSSDSPRR